MLLTLLKVKNNVKFSEKFLFVSPKSNTCMVVSYSVNTFSTPAVMSITHFLSTLFSAYFLWCFFNRGCTVQMSFPHSRIGMMPSPDVYVFQPKICSSCSPNVATSSSGFQDQVQMITMCCIMSLDHPQKAVVLVNWQAEHWGVQELP